MKYITRSEADTMAFAGCIAEMLADGDTVLLHGDLDDSLATDFG